MGKRLEAQIKQQGRYYRKKALEPYKGPYDCPNCCKPKGLQLRKHEATLEEITWIAICDNCNFFRKFTLPAILSDIDAYSKISDLVRSQTICH